MKRVLLLGVLSALFLLPLLASAEETNYEFPFKPGTVLTSGQSITIRGEVPEGTETVKAYFCIGSRDNCKVKKVEADPWSAGSFIPLPVVLDQKRSQWSVQTTLASSSEPFNFLVISFRPLSTEEKNGVKVNVWKVIDEYSRWRISHPNFTPEEDIKAMADAYGKYFKPTDNYRVGNNSLLDTLQSWRGNEGDNFINKTVQYYSYLMPGSENNFLTAGSDGPSLKKPECLKYYSETKKYKPDQAETACQGSFDEIKKNFDEIDNVVFARVDLYSASLGTALIDQIRKWLGFNAGLAYIGGINETQPYIGLSIYFLDASTLPPLKWGMSRVDLMHHVSLVGGYSFVTEQFPIEDECVSNIYYVGLGFRINPFANIMGGPVIYDYNGEGGHDQRHTWFVSLTVETFALQTIMENMAKPFVK